MPRVSLKTSTKPECFATSKELCCPPSYQHQGVKLSEFEGGSGTIYADSSEVRPCKTSDARLVLEDGSIWRVKSFGATGTQVGEVVFNTSLTGYQEILTDPSYAGQFVLMTNPHNGNTGVNPDDEKSSQCFLGCLIIRSLSYVLQIGDVLKPLVII